MNVPEHLLACLIEECAEVSHRACKALRFGIDDRDPTIEDAPTERVMLTQELNDLYAIVELLKEHEVLPLGVDWTALKLKKHKVRRFMDYARARGALTEPSESSAPSAVEKTPDLARSAFRGPPSDFP